MSNFIINSHISPATGGTPWFDNNWGRRIKLTIQNGKVAETLTNYPLYVALSDLPASFHANVLSDGGDIRVTKADGVTELPREVVTITTGSSIGEVHIEVDSVSSSADTSVYIYYDNSGASEPAVGATYGRNAVWATYRAVYHLQEDPSGSVIDSTGNGFTMADVGTLLAEDSVSGFLEGKGVQFESSKSQGLLHVSGNSFWSGTPAYPYTIEGLVFSVTAESVTGVIAGTAITSVIDEYGEIHARNASVGVPGQTARTSGANVTLEGSTDLRNAWAQVAARWKSATDRVLIADGVSEGTSATSVGLSTSQNTLTIGYRNRLGPTAYINATVDEVRFSQVDRTTNWFLSQWRNHSDTSTFYAVAGEETL